MHFALNSATSSEVAFCGLVGREVPSLLAAARGFREVVSRELVEDSTRNLVIVNLPTREHMTMVHLLV